MAGPTPPVEPRPPAESRPGAGRRSRAVLGITVVIFVMAGLLATTLAGVGTVVGRTVGTALPEPAVDMSSIEDLDEAIQAETASPSVVHAADGTVLGRFSSETLHQRMRPDAIPRDVELAVLAAEDDGFREHPGFDPAAMARALVANVRSGEIEEGGSTITQQLAKQLFTTGERTVERKLSEIVTAVELENRFSKDEILAAYLNATYFGQQAIGIEAAARTYFRKEAADLTLSEAAMLAGVVPSPSRYDPRGAPERAERRRQHVLDRIAELGWVSEERLAAAREDAPAVHPPRERIEAFGYYLDYVRRYLLDVADVPPDELFGAGLKIHTALDVRTQYAARLAVQERLPDPAGPSAAVVVADPRTGRVEALIGGRDFRSSEVNLALGHLGGGSGRQPGSSFKPFVLGTAFGLGASPRDTLEAPEEYLPRSVTDPEPVHNYTDRGYGTITLRTATVNSVNTAFVNLIEQIGVRSVATKAAEAGIRTLPEPAAVGPSLAIGAYETSPLAMTRAYGSFATDGRAIELSPIVEVLDRDGEPAFDLPEPGVTDRRVWDPESARLVTDLLVDNTRRGTATRARLADRTVAAKTGTSNDHENAWLAGYTAQRVAAVWVGHPEGNVSMRGVNGFARVTGGSIPALLWQDVMSVAHEGLEPGSFSPAPPRSGSEVVDSDASSDRSGGTPSGAGPGPSGPGTAPEGTGTTAPPETTTTSAPPPDPTTTTTPPTTAPPTSSTTTTQPSTTTTSSTTTTRPSTTTTTAPPETTTTTGPPTTTTEAPATTTTGAQRSASTTSATAGTGDA